MVSRNALAAAVLVAATAIAATAGVYLRPVDADADADVDFERGYEGAFVEGFHPRERADGKYFRWTDGASSVVLRHLPARGPIGVVARLKTIRPAGTPLPDLAFTANGVTVYRTRALPGLASYRFEFPSTSARLELGIDSDTFAAGGRPLGVQVLDVAMRLPRDGPSWILPALSMAGAALLLLATGLVARLSPLASGAAALVLSLGFVALLGFQAVRFTSYPRDVLLLAASVLLVAAALRRIFDRLGWLAPGERAVATALLALLLLVKLAIPTFPSMLSSDADFQANRMSEVLRGNFYPTSVTQHEPPFRIPYPVALYVVAAPLAKLGIDRVAALEAVTAVFDVLVSALLLFLACRFLDDFRAGLIAAVLYQLVPMNALSLSAGNFTNLFAVSMLALAFTLMIVSAATGDRRAIAGSGLATFVALAAHFGLLLEGVVLFPLWIVLFWLAPPSIRDERRRLTLAVVAAFVAAGLYYLGYLDLVKSQWGRVLSGTGAGHEPRAADVLSFAGEQLGYVFLATAFLGSLSFLRRPLGGPLFAASCGWLLVTVVFFGLDVFTPLEIRYWLQALPLLALCAGAYLSRAFERGLAGRIAAVAAVLYVGATGLRTLYDVMLFRYH
jgi:hypothetical protein